MDQNTLGEHEFLPRRMHRCFHYPPYIQVETVDNLLRKHACIIVPNLPCICFQCSGASFSNTAPSKWLVDQVSYSCFF